MSTARQIAEAYSKFGVVGTSLLAFNELPRLLKKYVKGRKAIDVGCGTGRSTQFLDDLGFQTKGVDNCPFFLEQAKQSSYQKNKYFLAEGGALPFNDASFDLAFSSFVLLMIPSKKKMKSICKEIYRILKPGAIFIVITGNEYMHSPRMKWVSYETDFAENENLKRGSLAKIRIKNNGAVFTDYNWLNEDYIEVLEGSGFDVIETLSPKASSDEDHWLSEKEFSPFLIYVARKKNKRGT